MTFWKTSKTEKEIDQSEKKESEKKESENMVFSAIDSETNSIRRFSLNNFNSSGSDINYIKKKYELLQVLYQTNAIKVADLAEELGCSKTEMMESIVKNKNFYVLQIPKSSAGLEIVKIYDLLEENPLTKEYLNKKIEDNKKKIWFVPIREYNSIAGWQFIESTDSADSEVSLTERNKSLWKNTKAKAEEIKKLGFLHKQQFYFGPYSERQPVIYDNAMLEAERKEMVEKFKNAGWEVMFER